MPTIAIIMGKIDGDVRRTTVGTPAKKVAEARIDSGDGWYTVVCWEALADQMPDSGSVLVHGRLRTRSYENKDKQKVYVTEIVASHVDQLGVGPVAADDDLTFAD